MADNTMSKLAADMAESLVQDHIGVDGAIVIVFRRGDDTYGAAMFGPTMDCDSLVAIGVEGLGMCRRAVLGTDADADASKTEG